jgi:type VI secretion system secreted protein VgrG
MASYVQANRAMTVTTPLGPDDLLLTGFQGQEAISQPFRFHLDLIADNRTRIDFDKLMGQDITINLALVQGGMRHFHGVCVRLGQGERDETFTAFRMEIVPRFWLLSRIFRSRIFQHETVPDILKKVLESLDVVYEIQGTWEPRDYCVQYRETDFDFASRLMEEEGIFYFFRHSADGHKLVLANTPQSHANLPVDSDLIFEEVGGGARAEYRIESWEKTQELRSGVTTLWDHCFELPGRHLEADQSILEAVQSGKVTHKLKIGGNDKMEIYDYPGAYAQRFDGIDKGGGVQAAELQKIFSDNQRTVSIRMQQETVPSLLIEGRSNCRHMVSGFKFNLQRHFDADGSYVLTGIHHSGSFNQDYRSGDAGEVVYENRFAAIPAALPFRPERRTVRPAVRGTHTATVVGPPGEEIFTDKYGRVKVQFHWDREGKYDADSSCWIRVGTAIAGRLWGAIFIPRIGQEVIVDFLEGDPDQPLIVGSVYNADQMPAYTLPDHKTKSGFKSYSSPGGGGFNEIRYEDKKGSEQIFIHGEKDLDIRIKNDRREWIGRDRHLIVKRDSYRQIERDEQVIVQRDRLESLGRDRHVKVDGKETTEIADSLSLHVGGDVIEEIDVSHTEKVGGDFYVQANKIVLEASSGLTLKVGGNFLTINPAGVEIKGTQVLINSGGSALTVSPGPLVPVQAPKEAHIADNADPGDKSPTYKNQPKPSDAPTHKPKSSKEEKAKKDWIEIELVDDAGKPVPGEPYKVTLPDGSTVAEGTLDNKGFARIDNIDPGSCKVAFPRLHKDAWKPK